MIQYVLLAIFAVLTTVFMSLYFMKKCKECPTPTPIPNENFAFEPNTVTLIKNKSTVTSTQVGDDVTVTILIDIMTKGPQNFEIMSINLEKMIPRSLRHLYPNNPIAFKHNFVGTANAILDDDRTLLVAPTEESSVGFVAGSGTTMTFSPIIFTYKTK